MTRYLEALDAARCSIDNAVQGICRAIVQAQQGPVTVDLSDQSRATLQKAHQQLLQKEEQLMKRHETAIADSLRDMNAQLESTLERFTGVFLDRRTYNIYYWSFMGMLSLSLTLLIIVIANAIKYGW